MNFFFRFLLSALFAGTLYLNYTSDVGAVSDEFPLLVTPPGWVFSIWGIIYLGLLGMVITLWKQNQTTEKILNTIKVPLNLNFIFNGLWVVAWMNAWYGTALILILSVWVTLIICLWRLEGIKTEFKKSTLFRWHRNTIGVYCGWLSIASFVNFTQYISLSSDIAYSENWSVFVLLLSAAWGIAAFLRFHNWAFWGVFLWALFGLSVKNFASTESLGAATIALIIVFLVLPFYQCKKQ